MDRVSSILHVDRPGHLLLSKNWSIAAQENPNVKERHKKKLLEIL